MFQQEFVDTVATAAMSYNEAAQARAADMVQELSVWDLTMRGGWIMIPLAVLSIVCVYIFIERCLVIRRAQKEDRSFMERIREYIHEGEIESARRLCRKTDTPYARLIGKGISRIGRPMNDVLVTIENTGNIEIAALEKVRPACHNGCRRSDDRLPRNGDRHGQRIL